MPTYEYVCDAGHETEYRQSMDDAPLETCPAEGCAAEARRMISVGAGLLVGRKAGSESRQATSTGACCGPGGCGCRM